MCSRLRGSLRLDREANKPSQTQTWSIPERAVNMSLACLCTILAPLPDVISRTCLKQKSFHGVVPILSSKFVWFRARRQNSVAPEAHEI